jgi:hypothetical protein
MPDNVYGANMAGVRAHVPLLELENNTRPSLEQVQGFIDRMTGVVTARVGDITGRADFPALAELARLAVELAAASLAEAATFPERANTSDASYSDVLWTRYRETLDDLLAALDIDEDEGPGAGGGAGGAVASFPEALYTRDIGF